MRRLWILLAIGVGAGFAGEAPKIDGPPLQARGDQRRGRNEQLRDELLRRMNDDQDARKVIVPLLQKHHAADPDEIKKMNLPEVNRVREIDHENTDRMKQIVKQFGWPGKSLVGTDGAHAAWLLVQHAVHDHPFQKRCLALLQAAVKKDEATGEQFAYLTDRVRVEEKKNQVYGTQLRSVNGKFQPQPIDDEANVDTRRKAVGLSPLAEYLRFSQRVLGQ